ncbi:MAG TPA: PQQ-binding-like beta-propeller repeat protein [Thermoanaerobaculia bacterium]|nr:PQQ-binding-like beta-propeller repeat protein [Thermoanaerobaculia bacterium]
MRSGVPMTLILCLVAGTAMAADWPQFRGPNRDGISRETGLLKSWPAGGPKVLWKIPMGEGFSHLTVAKGRLFTLYGQGAHDFAAAYHAGTGRPLWRVPLGRKYTDGQGNGPRSTPTVDGDMVYVLTARGLLAALNAAHGKKIWEHDLVRDFGAEPPQWGISTSPLVEGNLLLVDVGGSRGRSLAAFDKKTGKTVWTSQNEAAGYSAPIAITVGGIRQVVFFTGRAVLAVAPKDGKLLWRVPWKTDYDVNAATPIFVAPDKLYISSGYDTGAAMFRIKVAGGRVGAEEVWQNRRMKNQFSSSVLHNGHIYGFDNSVLKCIVAATGEEKWKESGFGHGSLILADGHLVVLSERGKLLLVEATPAGYREKGSSQPLSGKCWTGPTVAEGRLYLRNEENLLALDWRGAAPKPAAAKTGR